MLFTLPLLISAAAAFVLPAGLSDGVYMAHINADGLEVHTRISPSDTETLAARSASASDTTAESISARDPSALASHIATTPKPNHPILSKRIWSIWCGCGFTLDHANCDAAVEDFKRQVGGGVQIPPYTAWYSIRGNVVFFSCNSGDGTIYHDVNGVSFIAGEITKACGLYIAGTFQRQAYPYEASGYMRYSAGLDFCANAKTSPAHSC